MNNPGKHKFHRQRGFNLLEVLVGVLIFAIGMLALASLQGNLTRAVADANQRTVAVNLAEELIERRRGFATVAADPTGTLPAYADIVDESYALVRGGISYNVSSTVTEYYYDLATDQFTTTPPSGAGLSDFKQVQVTVSWAGPGFRNLDSSLISQTTMGTGSITISDTISSLSAIASSRATTQDDEPLIAPPVQYNPGARPDIISLSLGNNKFKESLLPEPDVVRQDELVETRFDVITYSQTDAGALFLRREEFVSIACDCILRAPSGAAATSGRRPTIWAGDEYIESHFVDKPYGEASNTPQSQFCGICCRDHHDGGTAEDDHSDTAVNLYDPFRSSSGYFDGGSFDGDHKHYNRVRQSSGPVALVLAESDGDAYVESCKLVRKDGFFRVAQDFRQEDLHVFPADFLDQQAEVDTYSSYVTGAANAFEDATYANYEAAPPCIGGPGCEAMPTWGGAWPTELGEGQFPSWTALPLGSDETQQLRSRGIYIDYLSDDMRTVIDCLRNGGDAKSCRSGDVVLDRTSSTNILELLPFYDVQLTFLNRWTESPTNTPVDTTNEGLADGNTHSRGVVSRDAFGGSVVEASGHGGNIGFTDTQAIDGTYLSRITGKTIQVQSLDYSGGGGGVPLPEGSEIILGSISETVTGVRATDVEVAGQNGVLCDRTVSGFECVVPPSAISNGRMIVYGYGKANADLWACLTGNELILESEVTNGTNAHAVFQLFGEPQPSGSGFDIHIQSSPCG